MTTSQPPPRKATRLSARSSAGHSAAPSNAAFTTPIFRHTPARSSEKCLASERGFVPWRFSDAGRPAWVNVRDGRRPKTFTAASDIR
jgi:hypothetical protein